jgi:hypothetical protein
MGEVIKFTPRQTPALLPAPFSIRDDEAWHKTANGNWTALVGGGRLTIYRQRYGDRRFSWVAQGNADGVKPTWRDETFDSPLDALADLAASQIAQALEEIERDAQARGFERYADMELQFRREARAAAAKPAKRRRKAPAALENSAP